MQTNAPQFRGTVTMMQNNLILHCGCQCKSILEITLENNGDHIGKIVRNCRELKRYVSLCESEEGISIARKQWESRKTKIPSENVEFVEQSWIEDYFQNPKKEWFDMVLGFFLLDEHWENEESATEFLQNIYDSLNDGGQFVGMMGDYSGMWIRAQKFKHWKKIGELAEIEVEYDLRQGNDAPYFGNRYSIQVKGEKRKASKGNLVHFPTLLKLCQKIGFDVISLENAQQYYNHLKDVYRKEFEAYGVFMKSKSFLPQELEILGLFNVIILRKQSANQLLNPYFFPIEKEYLKHYPFTDPLLDEHQMNLLQMDQNYGDLPDNRSPNPSAEYFNRSPDYSNRSPDYENRSPDYTNRSPDPDE